MHDDGKGNQGKPLTKKQGDRRTLALVGLELTGLIVLAVSIGLIVGSCGEKVDDTTSAAARPVAEGARSEVATVAGHVPAPGTDRAEVTSPDSLPPEVSASVIDTLVAPGSAIEITAEASVDATELSLWDGVGKRQRFSYDAAGKVWHAFYRVPLRSADRLGLSVTAKNDGGRWRRVWLFLRVDRGAGVTEPDSTK